MGRAGDIGLSATQTGDRNARSGSVQQCIQQIFLDEATDALLHRALAETGMHSNRQPGGV